MYIPALDVVQGLPEVDVEAEMEDVAQMGYSVTRAKNSHLRRAVNQFRLSEISVVVFTNDEERVDEAGMEYVTGTMFLRFGDAFEIPVTQTPTTNGAMFSSFTDYSDNSTEQTFSEETWGLLAEATEWGEAGDLEVPFPFEAKDVPPEERWHVWNGIVGSAYGQSNCSVEIRVILELAEFHAGRKEDVRLLDL